MLRALTALALAVTLSACLGEAEAPGDAVDLASTERQALACELPVLTRPGSTVTSPGDPRAGLCQGPWEYRGYQSCSRPNCGPSYCAEYNTCRNWSAWTTAVETLDETVSVLRPCRTFEWGCSNLPDRPENVCAERAAQLRNQREQRQINVGMPRSLGSRVEESHTLGALMRTDSNFRYYACRVVVRYPDAPLRAQAACGCKREERGWCQKEDPACPADPNPRYKHAGGVAPTSSSAEPIVSNSPRCTTCEWIPLPEPGWSADDEARWASNKMACLYQTYSAGVHAASNPHLDAAMTLTLKRESTIRMKLLFEHYAPQIGAWWRMIARGLYETEPASAPRCEHGWTYMSHLEARECPAELMRRLPMFDLCERLAQAEASPVAAAEMLPLCVEAMNAVSDARVSGSEARCIDRILGPTRAAVDAVLANGLAILTNPALADDAAARRYALAHALYLVDTWYAMAANTLHADATLEGISLDDAEVHEQLYPALNDALGRLWSHLAEGPGNVPSAQALEGATAEQMRSLLARTAAAADAFDREILELLYTDMDLAFARAAGICPTSGDCAWTPRPPMQAGVPLAVITADVLHNVVDGLELVAPFHDLACTFRDCLEDPPVTPSTELWRALASADDAGALDAAVIAGLGAWRAPFAAFARGLARWTASLPADVGAIDAEVPAWAASAHSLLVTAKTRWASFELTGQFNPIATSSLRTGVHDEAQNLAIELVGGATTDLRSRLDLYGERVLGLVADLREQLRSRREVAGIAAQLEAKRRERDRLADELGALVRSVTDSRDQFADLADALAAARDALDGGELMVSGDTQRTQIHARNATFGHAGTPLAELVAYTLEGLHKGDALSITTEGLYSPTCALTQIGYLPNPGDNAPVRVELGDAETGPRGFYATWNGRNFTAHAHTRSTSTSVGLGASTPFFAGPSFSVTDTTTDSTSYGSEAGTSLSLVAGIRLPNTPFPGAPAGALLAVEVDAPTGELLDVHVLQDPRSTVYLDTGDDVTVHLVVNDLGVCAPRGNAMTVSITPLQPASARATKVIEGIQQVLRELPGLVTQADLVASLPSLPGSVLADARQRLEVLIAPATLADFPGLGRVVDTFVQRELVRRERLTTIYNLRQALALIEIELAALEADRELAAASSRLQSLIPARRLRSLEGLFLREHALDLIHNARNYLAPVLRLRYPEALADLQAGTLASGVSVRDAFDKLLQVDTAAAPGAPLTSAHDLALSAVGVMEFVQNDLAWGRLAAKNHHRTVVLSFPQVPGRSQTRWLKAEAELAAEVWAAIRTDGQVTLSLTPEQLYSATTADNALFCNEAAPIIRHLGLIGVTSGNTEGLPQPTVRALASDAQYFADTGGLVSYRLDNARWQRVNVPIYWGRGHGGVAAFDADADREPVGLSPFSALRLDLSGLGAVFTPAISEVALVMEIEYRGEASELGWIGSCR